MNGTKHQMRKLTQACTVLSLNLSSASKQRTKKVMSDSPGLVDFAVALVTFFLNLPDGQVLFFGEIQVTEGL